MSSVPLLVVQNNSVNLLRMKPQKPRPRVKYKVWHDKDPSLLKGKPKFHGPSPVTVSEVLSSGTYSQGPMY